MRDPDIKNPVLHGCTCEFVIFQLLRSCTFVVICTFSFLFFFGAGTYYYSECIGGLASLYSVQRRSRKSGTTYSVQQYVVHGMITPLQKLAISLCRRDAAYIHGSTRTSSTPYMPESFRLWRCMSSSIALPNYEADDLLAPLYL